MRIVGQIAHPILKITVMVMNDKFVVKVEFDLLEQTYKLRTSDEVSSLEHIEQLIDDAFLNQCIERFKQMQVDLYSSYERNLKKN